MKPVITDRDAAANDYPQITMSMHLPMTLSILSAYVYDPSPNKKVEPLWNVPNAMLIWKK